MKLFVETQSGSSFEIEVDNSDTLLSVKQKIERSQNIPVSEQLLAVDGVAILPEDLNVEHCRIVQDSRLQVFVSPKENPNHNNDQVLQPEQSPEPFISVEDYFVMREWPLSAEEIEKIYSAPPRRVQTEESPSSSNSVRETTNVQDSPVRNNDQSQPSDAAKQIINSNQDSTVTVQTEESTPSSNSVNENVSIPMNVLRTKIPVRLSYLGAKKLVMTVNRTDHVKRLRSSVNNVDHGYVFMHKGRLLNEDQSFQWNGVGFLSTIEIVPNP